MTVIRVRPNPRVTMHKLCFCGPLCCQGVARLRAVRRIEPGQGFRPNQEQEQELETETESQLESLMKQLS